jgi:hypothetical protein
VSVSVDCVYIYLLIQDCWCPAISSCIRAQREDEVVDAVYASRHSVCVAFEPMGVGGLGILDPAFMCDGGWSDASDALEESHLRFSVCGI